MSQLSRFVISLDFELFWGVCDTQTVARYGRNVEGEWEAVPRTLELFRRYGIRATWATVGMVMCRDYAQWRAIRPDLLPGYRRPAASPYELHSLVQEHPRLFLARPLVSRILDTPGQELASHTYSHFYCGEAGATPEQFAADLACWRSIAADLGVSAHSIVFPRNQVVPAFLDVLPAAGIRVYRGNPDHWLYRNGDRVPGGRAGRAVRYADACLPLSGARTEEVRHDHGLLDLPASLFLYPSAPRFGRVAAMRPLEAMRLWRVKRAMTDAARSGRLFHLWWHPHNFGLNTEQNLAMLEAILQHYRGLADRFGMHSNGMRDVATLSYRAHQGSAGASNGGSVHVPPQGPPYGPPNGPPHAPPHAPNYLARSSNRSWEGEAS